MSTAPTQIVTTTFVETPDAPANHVTLELEYNTTDNKKTTGASINIHYNSALLQPVGGVAGLTNVLREDDLVGDPEIVPDDNNLDGDENTDKFIRLAWLSTAGTFPGRTASLPAIIANITFSIPDGLFDTDVNITTTSPPVGYEFIGNGVQFRSTAGGDQSIGNLSSTAVAENTVYTSTTPDPIGFTGDVTWSLGGDDYQRFEWSEATGVVTMKPQDYESPADDNSDNVYEYYLTAADVDGHVATTFVTVTIENVNEAPSLLISEVKSFTEGDGSKPGDLVATFVTSDPDGDTVSVILSDEDNYELGTGEAAGSVLLKQAGVNLVNNGSSLPEFQLIPSDGTLTGAVETVRPSVTAVNDPPALVVTQTNTFTEDSGVAAGAVVATFTTSDPESSPVSVFLSDTTYYVLGTGDKEGAVLLTEAGLELVNDGLDLPSFTLTPNDGSLSGASQTVDPIVVPATNNSPTGGVTISGDARQRETLFATEDIQDADGISGLISVEWFANGSPIQASESNARALELTQNEVGKIITVIASYTDDEGNPESVESLPSAPVENINDEPIGKVTIEGTAEEGRTLTVRADIQDDDGVGVIAYQWLANSEPIEGEFGIQYILTQADVNKRISVRATYQDLGGTSESLLSDQTDLVLNVNSDPLGSVVISGRPEENETLTADITSITDADGLGDFAFQWLADEEPIPGAINATYTLGQADVGKVFKVIVSYKDAQGTDEELVSNATAPISNVNNAPTGGLQLYGVFEQGQTVGLIDSIEDEDGLGERSYQWLADGFKIPGGTGQTIVLTQNEVGKKISVAASYIDKQGKPENVPSGLSTPVANINDDPVGNISIAGIPFEGQTLRAIVGSIMDADGVERLNNNYTFSWERSDGKNSTSVGTNSANYTTTQDDVGANLKVTVAYTDKGGFTNTITSQETKIFNVNNRPTGAVSISGDLIEGGTLTAVTDSVKDTDGLGELKYQWRSNGVNILGANGASYELSQVDVGKSISLVVSYDDDGGTTEALSSFPTPPVANINNGPSGSVVINGVANQGQTLVASTESINDPDGLGRLIYQWQSDGEAILGAISSQYTLTQADVGKPMSVVVSYVDRGGTSETLTSAATNPVENMNDAPKGAPVIVGVLAEGFVLTASTSSITDADGLGGFSYQWLRNGSEISNANGETYVLTGSDIGTGISVRVSYTDGQGYSETITSRTSASVLSTNDRFTGEVNLSAVAWQQGQPLSADTSALFFNNAVPNNLSYQWYANGAIIDGEDSSVFTPGQAQVGQLISVLVSATDEVGTASKWSVTSDLILNQDDAPTGEAIFNGLVNDLPKEDVAIEIDPNSIEDLDGRTDDFAYEWSVDGIGDAGIQGATFTPTDAYVGKELSVRISYTDDYGNDESLSYNLGTVQNTNDKPTGSLTVKGLLVAGQTLSVVDSIADDDGLTERTYLWQRSLDDGISWASINTEEQADPSIYTLTAADAGSKIRVAATYTDGNRTVETVESSITSRIIGQLSEGRRIAYSGANPLEPLQWQLNGADLVGEVGPSLLTANNWGNGSIQLMIAGEAVSNPITVEKINHGPGIVKPLEASGDLIAGVVLTAGTPLDDIDGIDLNTAELTYQWQRYNNVDKIWSDIDGATAASYATTESDVDQSLRAKISYIDEQDYPNVVFTNSLRPKAIPPLAPIGSFSAITNDDILTAGELTGDPISIEGTFVVGEGNQGAVTITFGGQVRTGILDSSNNSWSYKLTESDEAFLVPGVNVIGVTLTLTETNANATNRGSKTFSRNLIIAEDALLSGYDPNSAADPTQADGIKQEVKDAARDALSALGDLANQIGQPNVAAAPLGSSSAFLSGADAPADSYGVFELPGDTRAAGVTTYTPSDNGYQIPDASGDVVPVNKPDASEFDTLSDPIALTVKDVEPGATITVNFTLPQSIADALPEDLSQATYLKLKGDTFEDYRDSGGVYYTYIDINGGPRVKGDVIELQLTLTDGSEWDRDGIANGIIVDPGMFAALVPAATDDTDHQGQPDGSNPSSGGGNTPSSGSGSGAISGASASAGTSSSAASTTNVQTREQAVAADGSIVDGNRDGIADVDQATVFGLALTNRGAKGSDYGALVVEPGVELQSVVLTQPSQDGTVAVTTRTGAIIPVAIPTGISNVFDGVVSFDAVGITPGGSTTASIIFPSDLSIDSISGYLRFNYSTNRFEEYLDAQGNPLYSFADGNGDGAIDRVILSLTDGDPSWDGDGVINGAVVDPGFAAQAERLIRATRANDPIIGNVLANTLIGSKANNKLFGDLGPDILKAKAGIDKLVGGEGADKLIGGAGRDTYIYADVLDSTATNADVISMRKEDRISLRAVDANRLVEGKQSFDLIGKDRFSSVAGELRITKKGLFGDTDGDGIADFVIGFNKNISITSSHIII